MGIFHVVHLYTYSNSSGKESWLYCADINFENSGKSLWIKSLRSDKARIWTQDVQFTQDWLALWCLPCALIRWRMWIFHFSCGIHIWLRGRSAPSPILAFAHGDQLWLPPGVEMEQSQDCTSKTSREVCTASSWLWPQLHAFWAVWN